MCFIQQQNSKLNGKYRVEYDKKYAQGSYIISFSDSIFRKTMPDAVMYKGKINYGKFTATIRKDNNDDVMEIDNKEFNKDTIKFTTKNKTDLSRIINRGLMIRVGDKRLK